MLFAPSPDLRAIDFPPYRLDLRAGQLYRNGIAVRLRPKSFAVLQQLAERPGALLTKRALLDAVWGDVAVTEDVVRLSVRELRLALGDEPATPRFIETVSRRGYRFIANLDTAGSSTRRGTAERAIENASSAPAIVVGRTRERGEIAEWLRMAASGRRQIGFVSGEAGIGKTTLVDAVLADLHRAAGTQLRIGRGQCIEHYGGGEPYLPLLEALTSLCRGSDGPTVSGVLGDRAPRWLLSAIGLLAPSGDARAESGAGAPEHTLHRLAASLEALAAETPLVLLLEDVHWIDYSTLDLLSVLAQRRGSARLLVLCTLRPTDAIVRGHPVKTVKRELLRKELCREILLGGLSAADAASYLAARFPGAALPENLAALLVDRSGGNPFFLEALLDHVIEQRPLVDGGARWELRADLEALRVAIPAGLRAVIEPTLERLAPDELRVLEAASVAGLEFTPLALAGAVTPGSDLADVEYLERICDGLARRQEILRVAGESRSPDGSTSARYAFRHALYEQVIYQGLSPSKRWRLHHAIGERLEVAYRGRTTEVASELAAHFARSADVERAVHYHGEAAAHARSRIAYQEERLHLEAALDLLAGQPETANRLRQELRLLHDLGSTLFAIRGYGDQGAARAFARMRELAERLDVAPLRLRAMDGLLVGHTMRAEYAAAQELAAESIALAEQLEDPVAMANTHVTLGATLLNLGEVLAARHHAERVRALANTEALRLPAVFGISSCCISASTSAHLGHIAHARTLIDEALARAATHGVPYLRAQTTTYAAQLYTLLRNVAAARTFAEEALHLATEYGFSVFRIAATIVLGWCDVAEGRVTEGLAALTVAVREHSLSGERVSSTAFAVLVVEAHLASGDIAVATRALDAALAFAAETGERVNEPELYRLRGECLLAWTPTREKRAEAIACLERAQAVAGDHGTLLLELRAARSLCRVDGKTARERLARLVDRFGADDDCADLRAARLLLGAGIA